MYKLIDVHVCIRSDGFSSSNRTDLAHDTRSRSSASLRADRCRFYALCIGYRIVVGQANMGNILDLGNLLNQLDTKLAQEPNNPVGWELAARTYMKLGNYEKAETAFEKLNSLVSDNPDFLVD